MANSGSEGGAFLFERSVRVQVGRERLWSLIADTERLNREAGLPSVRFAISPREEGGSFLRGEMKISGLTLRYVEEPYRWVRPAQFSVNRLLDNGPLTRIALGMRFAAEGDNVTDATAWFEVTPRAPIAVPVARAVATIGVNSLLNACRGFEAFLRDQAATPYPRHAGAPPADRERLAQAVDALTAQDADRDIAARLAVFLTEAPIEDVIHIRPFALADRWGVSRAVVLHTSLLAVQAELLELRWRILCPACRGAGDSVGRMGDLSKGEAHCPSCNIRFGPQFDRSVEVCFRVAPRIRPAGEGEATYCIGGPGHSPHVALQWPLAPGEVTEITPNLAPGRYALTSPQVRERVEIEVSGEEQGLSSEAAVTVRAVSGGGSDGCAFVLREAGKAGEVAAAAAAMPANGPWRFTNTAAWPVVVRLETPGWLADVATAAVVTSLQTFRDAFGSQVLSPGVEIAVRQITILFSDLKGSTQMYRVRGDAASYATVRDHFSLVRDVVARHGGGILKTIGDAVMAVFPDPADALSAALEIQRLCALQKDPLTVKLGLHAGPALAVNANDTLDYFGQVVNLAARIQAQSEGGDVVLARALAGDPRIAPLLSGLKTEALSVTLRGMAEPIQLLRLWPEAELS